MKTDKLLVLVLLAKFSDLIIFGVAVSFFVSDDLDAQSSCHRPSIYPWNFSFSTEARSTRACPVPDIGTA